MRSFDKPVVALRCAKVPTEKKPVRVPAGLTRPSPGSLLCLLEFKIDRHLQRSGSEALYIV